MSDLTDEQFENEVAALEQELAAGSAAIAKSIESLRAELNADFAATDAALVDFYDEVANGSDV